MKITLQSRRILTPLSWCALAATLTWAQSVPSGEASSEPAEQQEILQLQPFEVNAQKDTGYVAQNTISGSRLNTSLQDTPASISVFTEEFLADIAAVDISDLSNYTLNTDKDIGDVSDLPNGNNLAEFSTSFFVRGLPTDSRGGRSVNFFRRTIEADTFTTERVEFARGPNAILFGVGPAGGNFNLTTKTADPRKAKYRFGLRGSDYDELRATVDINQPIIPGKLALRVNALSESRDSWRPHEFRSADRMAVTTRWQISKRTTLDIEYERGRVEESSQRPYLGADQVTDWMTTGMAIDPVAGSPRPTGLANIGSANTFVYTTNTGTVANWRNMSTSGTGFSAAADTPMLRNFDLVPKEAVLGGDWIGNDIDYGVLTAVFRHEVAKNFYVELAGLKESVNYGVRDVGNQRDTRIQIDTNAQLPNGQPNPYAGKPYVETQGFVTRDREEKNKNLRLTASYEIDLGPYFGKHRMAGLAERRIEDYHRSNQFLEIVKSPPTASAPANATNRLRFRTYVDLDGPVEDIALQDLREIGLPSGTGWVQTAENLNRSEITSLMIADQSSFLKNRLFTTFGYRVDTLDFYGDVAGTSTDLIGDFTAGYPISTRSETPLTTRGTTRSVGAVFHVTKWLSVFGNRSTNFNVPNPQIIIFPTRESAPAPKGRSTDYGLKLLLLQDRVFLTLTHYETAATDLSNFLGDRSDIYNSIWETLDQAGVLAATGKSLAAETFTFVNGYTYDQKATGDEIEVVANLTGNWRLYAGYSQNKMVTDNLGPQALAYIAANRDYWTQGDRGRLLIRGNGALAPTAIDASDGLDDTIAEVVSSQETNFDTLFVQPAGAYKLGIPRTSFNFRTNYSFRDGWLKGVSAGLGARVRGKIVQGYTSSDPATREVIYGGMDAIWDGNLGYRRKAKWLGKNVNWSVQLNVNNLLNNDDIEVTRVKSDGSIRDYRFRTPRHWILSTTVDF